MKTELLFILDRSGSMQSIKSSTISGFNDFLSEHLEAPGEATLSLILFDDQYETPYNRTPIHNILPLSDDSYTPRGSTALLDATARAIDELGQQLASLPEHDRPETVIVAILTDGLENASHLHTWQDVQQRIHHQTDTYNWTFLFLGANQDAIATAANLGIQSHNAATYRHDDHGTGAVLKSVSLKSLAIRKSKFTDLSPDETIALNEPLQTSLDKEDKKSRQTT